MAKAQLTMELSAKTMRRLVELKEITAVSDVKEVVRNALRFYDHAITKIAEKENRKLGFKDDDESFEEISVVRREIFTGPLN